jgi:hypothetical protein
MKARKSSSGPRSLPAFCTVSVTCSPALRVRWRRAKRVEKRLPGALFSAKNLP